MNPGWLLTLSLVFPFRPSSSSSSGAQRDALEWALGASSSSLARRAAHQCAQFACRLSSGRPLIHIHPFISSVHRQPAGTRNGAARTKDRSREESRGASSERPLLFAVSWGKFACRRRRTTEGRLVVGWPVCWLRAPASSLMCASSRAEKEREVGQIVVVVRIQIRAILSAAL